MYKNQSKLKMKMMKTFKQCSLKYWLRKRLVRVKVTIRKKIKRSKNPRKNKKAKRVRMSFD